MKRIMTFTLFILLVFLTAFAYADEQKGFKSLTDEIDISLLLRPRYEYVDVEDNSNSTAKAFTVRTSLGLGFKNLFKIEGLKTYLEATNVSNFFLDDYNSTSAIGGNNNTRHEAVIDPPISRITQAYISYTNKPLTLGLGRRVLNLDNQRFVGSVGWRQMPQTFGVVDLTLNLNKKAKVYTAYVYRRNGIKDEFNKNIDSVLANANYTFIPQLKVTAYAYLIDETHDTFGLRLTGDSDINSTTVNYALEGAVQNNPSINGNNINADSYYYSIEAGLGYEGFILKGNYEVLGEAEGNATQGFSTPWATLHAFNGWSDALLGKASAGDADGVTDANATIGYKDKDIGKILFVYHKFDSVKNSKDYGSEYGFLYIKKLAPIKLVAKAARYEKGDDFGNDTTKFWLMAVYNFKESFM